MRLIYIDPPFVLFRSEEEIILTRKEISGIIMSILCIRIDIFMITIFRLFYQYKNGIIVILYIRAYNPCISTVSCYHLP